MVNFTKLYNFNLTISLHSQGEEIYQMYGEELGKKFAYASGYTLTTPDYNSSFAGYKDWFTQEYRKPGFTIEIGKGENPLPLSDIQNIYDQIEEIFFIAADE